MIKKLIFSFLLMVTVLNAYESDLIRPKALQPTIIDIGITIPSEHNTIIPKEWILIDAQFREIDKEKNYVARELSEKWDCMSDYAGTQNCPEQQETCPQSYFFSSGNSTKKVVSKEAAPFKVSVQREESINPNSIKGDYQILPTGGELDGSRFIIEKNGIANTLSTAALINEGYVTENGKFGMRMFNFGSGCGGFSVSPTPSRVKTIVDGGSSVRLQGYKNNCDQLISSGDAKYAVVLVEWDTTPSNVSFTCDDYCLIGQPDLFDLGFWSWTCPIDYIAGENTTEETTFCNSSISTIKRKWWWCDTCNTGILERYITEVVNAVGGSGLDIQIIEKETPFGRYTLTKKIYTNTAPENIFIKMTNNMKIAPGDKFEFIVSNDKPRIKNITSGSVTGGAADKPFVFVTANVLVENCTTSNIDYPTTCLKKYNYYLYDCDPIDYPAGYLYEGTFFWEGPLVETGGDCFGTCSGYDCNCNSPVAPSNNCRLANLTCPFDITKKCTAVATETGDPLLADENYIYENGTSLKYTDRLVEERSCTEGMVWNATDLRCEDVALKKCLSPGYTIDLALNECFGPASCLDNEIYDTSLLKCIEKKTDKEKCGETFLFDNNANKCVKAPECSKGGIFEDGKCKTKIDTCLSGEYDVKGECNNLVGVHLFANILLEANIGSMHGVEKGMTFHIDETIPASTINTSSLQEKGYTSNGTDLKMKVFHYGSGCGGIKFNPAPDKITVLQNGGSILNNTDPSLPCGRHNYIITSQDKEFMKVELTWNNPPENITYECDDFCALDKPSYIIDKSLISLSSEVCPSNKTNIFWRYSENKNKCIADMLTEPFICEGEDWIYDPTENICAALLNNWHIADGAYPGVWYISPDKRKMYQSKNGGVILNISDKIYEGNVVFKGDFIIMDGSSTLFDSISSWATRGEIDRYKDDDFIGFVFGYDEFNKDGFLFSINKSLLDPDAPGRGHSFDGYTSVVSGASLRKGNPLIHGWGLGTTSGLTVLNSNLGSAAELRSNTNIYRGWNRNEKTTIKIDYSISGIKIWINDKLIIDHPLAPGEFKKGKIGFLNYSQGSVLYDGFEILTSDLCREGYQFSDILNTCYVPVSNLYTNVGGRTFVDNLNEVFYESETICPLNGHLSGDGYCEYDLLCADGTYNINRLFCEKPMNTDLCIIPQVQSLSSLYKKKELNKEVINIKASGEFYYSFPTLKGKKSGLSLSNTLIKLSDNNWYKFDVQNSDASLRDTLLLSKGINAILLNESEYIIHNYSGAGCYDNTGTVLSNDCISDIDIKIPAGLSILEISDIENITNVNTGDNFYDDRFEINSIYGYNRKGFGGQPSIILNGVEPICSQLPICPDGEVLSYDDDLNPICKSNNFSLYCKDQQTLVKDTGICANDGFCSDGYINLDLDGTCIRDYNYFKYFCPEGYEIAEEGIDCEGSCGFDDCFCNTETPPANNCKKIFNSDDFVEQTSVRTIRTHTVTGSLLEEEYGNYKNYNCGENCKFNIVKITGEENKLCFEKKNGDSSCFEVEGCSFKGTIQDLYSNAEVPKLRDLNLPDTHTLTIVDYNVPSEIQSQDTITCGSSGMSYSTATRYCEGSANFYNWEKEGSASGDWSVTNEGSKVFQGFNTTSPAFYVSKITYPKNVILSGSMTTGNDGDDDWVGMVFGYTGVNDYYVIRLSRDPNDPISHRVTHTGDKLSLIKVTGGVASTLKTAAHPGWRANVGLDIKVAYIDNQIIVFIDDNKYIEYSSPIDLVGGRIGFYNLSQSTVTYNNFHISSSPLCAAGYEWEDAARSCVSTAEQVIFPNNKIESTCKMNGHIGWHSREEGIVSIISDGDRLKFWDPYKDKNLGFLEFVKDTNEEDNIDGFRPEEQKLYNLLSDGFTAIEKIGTNLFFVSGEIITDDQCSFFATKYNLFKYTTLQTESLDLKVLSGDRYRFEIQNPKCNQGVYAEDINECISGLNSPNLCVNGKFETSEELTVLSSYGISAYYGLSTVQPIEIYNSGEYTIEMETTGTLNVSLDGVSIAAINSVTEPYARFKMTLEKGFHKFEIGAGPLSSFALTVSDDSETKFFNSREWCDNTSEVTCPLSGYTNYNNICELKTSMYCEQGEFNDITKKCSLPPKCILKGTGITFADQEQSVKVEYFENSSVKYMCSPLTCVDNSCQLATCPDPSIGTDVEITATELEEAGEGILCLDQECDANLPYYELCGIQGYCNTNLENVFEEGEYPNEICLEKYCDEGVFDPISGKCKVLRCPSNTTEDTSGNCIRN